MATNNTGYSTGTASPDDFDLSKLFQSLFSSSTRSVNEDNIPGGQQFLQSTGQSTPTVNPATGLHDDQAKALKTVLASQDKEHAQEAVSMYGADAMRQLLDFHMSTAPSNQDSSTGANTSTQQPVPVDNTIDSQIADKQKQIQLNTLNQLVEASKAPNFLQKFSQNFSKMNGGMTQADYLSNIASVQKLAAGQPAEIALPSAEAANQRALTEYQNLKNSGNEPIQPEQYMNAYAGMYQKAYEAHAAVAKTGGDIAKTSQELMKATSDQTRNSLQKMVGSQSKESLATFESSVAAQKAALDATSDFSKFMLGNSPAAVMEGIRSKVSQNVNKNNQQQQNTLLKPGQTTTINGKQIKRLN